jgi:hypothetical protein
MPQARACCRASSAGGSGDPLGKSILSALLFSSHLSKGRTILRVPCPRIWAYKKISLPHVGCFMSHGSSEMRGILSALHKPRMNLRTEVMACSDLSPARISSAAGPASRRGSRPGISDRHTTLPVGTDQGHRRHRKPSRHRRENSERRDSRQPIAVRQLADSFVMLSGRNVLITAQSDQRYKCDADAQYQSAADETALGKFGVAHQPWWGLISRIKPHHLDGEYGRCVNVALCGGRLQADGFGTQSVAT